MTQLTQPQVLLYGQACQSFPSKNAPALHILHPAGKVASPASAAWGSHPPEPGSLHQLLQPSVTTGVVSCKSPHCSHLSAPPSACSHLQGAREGLLGGELLELCFLWGGTAWICSRRELKQKIFQFSGLSNRKTEKFVLIVMVFAFFHKIRLMKKPTLKKFMRISDAICKTSQTADV